VCTVFSELVATWACAAAASAAANVMATNFFIIIPYLSIESFTDAVAGLQMNIGNSCAIATLACLCLDKFLAV
jgi:hypothetical protein